MSLWLSGIGVARGIALGRVLKQELGDPLVPARRPAPGELDGEVLRFMEALLAAQRQLRAVRAGIAPDAPDGAGAFIDAQLLMMEDRAITESTVRAIHAHGCNAETALLQARDALCAVFERMEDPYLRARQDDVEHVCARIMRLLLRGSAEAHAAPAEGPRVLVADRLSPADVISAAAQSVVAFITERGGPMSHAAILARAYSMPAVVGVHGACSLLRDGEPIIVDGGAGHVLADPDEQVQRHYRRRAAQQAGRRRALDALQHRPAVSLDGVRVALRANVERAADADAANRAGAEGVGLFRTEFLYMNRSGLPDEEEQVGAYAALLQAVRGPITIRTLDLGADKQAGGAHGLSAQCSPLGLRAIRWCLREPEIFRTQLRALLRASAFGSVRIVLPMISTLHELRQARQLIAACRNELQAEGRPLAARIPMGAMIETPAAAIAAPLLTGECDFFSIGTNDLIQYALAIDRGDEEVAALYDPLHPAVLRLIAGTIEAGQQACIPVAMCGEMAGDPQLTPLLLGLGLQEFSMHPEQLPEIKRAVCDADVGTLRASVRRLLQARSAGDYEHALAALLPSSPC